MSLRGLAPSELVDRARSGDRRALARLITLVEEGSPRGLEALALVFPATGNAWTTGLTGAPGAGKSTLTDRLIGLIRAEGKEVAVVAVDPSSPFSGGAILGDRVRMQAHIDDPGVYIRSLASRGHLGGISEATPRVLALLDGLGFPEILVETVGVGQAEVEIVASADTTVVVVNPGWGDSIQAAKAGLLEIGDVFAVNKADRPGVDETVRDLRMMLEMGGHRDWTPPIVPTVAATGQGVDELWQAIGQHRRHLVESGELAGRRRRRLLSDLHDAVTAALRRHAETLLASAGIEALRADVLERRLDPWSASRRVVDGM